MKMIKLTEKHYILVDDKFDPIGSDGKYVHKSGRIWQWDSMMAYVSNNPPQLITHSTQPLELICCTPVGQIKRYIDCKGCDRGTLGYNEVKPLPLSEVKELLGVVDVEKKGEKKYPKSEFWVGSGPSRLYDENAKERRCYIEGYKEALEDNKEQKYTEEDMRKAYYQGHKSGLGSENGLTFEHTIQSLQPTEWEVEFVNGKLKLKS